VHGPQIHTLSNELTVQIHKLVQANTLVHSKGHVCRTSFNEEEEEDEEECALFAPLHFDRMFLFAYSLLGLRLILISNTLIELRISIR
jgi:hypothetical protein